MVVRGSIWSYFNLFWLDLAWAPAIGCFLAAVATSRPRFVVRVLDSRLPRSLGSCSYSLYLTHLPIVIAVSYGLVLGRVSYRDADVLRAGRDPAARDRVLRLSVRRCVRAPLPAAPRVGSAAAGDVGPAVAAAANRAGRRRRALAAR